MRGRGIKGRGEGRKGKGEGEERDRGRWREGKENGDRPPTIFGLKVALNESVSSPDQYALRCEG